VATTDAGLFYLYFVHSTINILPVQADEHDGSSSVGKLRGWAARQHMGKADTVPTPALCGQQRYADHVILICIIPQSLTKDPHLLAIAICSLESAVSPRLSVSLYS